MPYKIAIASSDGMHIDETFGSAAAFHIYDITGESYAESEIRNAYEESPGETAGISCDKHENCGQGSCHGSGCSGKGEVSPKVELISDCRCVVCKKIGFHIQKQLERKAITAFDVTCTVEEALEKISSYFNKVDKHQSLRNHI